MIWSVVCGCCRWGTFTDASLFIQIGIITREWTSLSSTLLLFMQMKVDEHKRQVMVLSFSVFIFWWPRGKWKAVRNFRYLSSRLLQAVVMMVIQWFIQMVLEMINSELKEWLSWFTIRSVPIINKPPSTMMNCRSSFFSVVEYIHRKRAAAELLRSFCLPQRGSINKVKIRVRVANLVWLAFLRWMNWWPSKRHPLIITDYTIIGTITMCNAANKVHWR